MNLPLLSVQNRPRPSEVTHRGSEQNRKLSLRQGKLKRRETLREFRKWNDKIQKDVSAIKDFNLLSTVAFILDCIADTEDVCGQLGCIEVTDGGVYRLQLKEIRLDEEIRTSLFVRYGRDVVRSATVWISNWLRDNKVPFSWIGWRLGHMVVDNDPDDSKKYRVEFNHVILDLHITMNTVGISLLDGTNLFDSTVLPFPTWQEDEASVLR